MNISIYIFNATIFENIKGSDFKFQKTESGESTGTHVHQIPVPQNNTIMATSILYYNVSDYKMNF
jgi:hypothetical protein